MRSEYTDSIINTFFKSRLRKGRRFRMDMNEITLTVCCETVCHLLVKSVSSRSTAFGLSCLDSYPMQQISKRKYD